MKEKTIRPNLFRSNVLILSLTTMLISSIVWFLRFLYLTKDLNFKYTKIALEESIRLDPINFWAFSFSSIAYIISIVFFVLWFRRAYWNLNQLSETRFKNYLTGIVWFIPIVHWIFPFIMISELFKKTNSLLQKNGLGRNHDMMRLLLMIWWFFYVICGLFALIINFVNFNKLPNGILEYKVIVLNDSMGIILNVLVILVVIHYRKFEIALSQVDSIQVRSKAEELKLDLLDN